MVSFGRSTVLLALVAVVLTAAAPAQADLFTLTTAEPPQLNAPANNQGWWSNTRSNINQNDNYFVGRNGSDLTNDYFTFHLGSFQIPAGQVLLSAALNVTRGVGTGNVTQTLKLSDVSTPSD